MGSGASEGRQEAMVGRRLGVPGLGVSGCRCWWIGCMWRIRRSSFFLSRAPAASSLIRVIMPDDLFTLSSCDEGEPAWQGACVWHGVEASEMFQENP